MPSRVRFIRAIAASHPRSRCSAGTGVCGVMFNRFCIARTARVGTGTGTGAAAIVSHARIRVVTCAGVRPLFTAPNAAATARADASHAVQPRAYFHGAAAMHARRTPKPKAKPESSPVAPTATTASPAVTTAAAPSSPLPTPIATQPPVVPSSAAASNLDSANSSDANAANAPVAASGGFVSSFVCGIDEAGRGALLGPMTIAAVVVSRSTERFFSLKKIRDSKVLSDKRREEFAELIRHSAIEYCVCTVSAAEIDRWRGDGINLNEIEARCMTRILIELQSIRSAGGAAPESHAAARAAAAALHAPGIYDTAIDNDFIPKAIDSSLSADAQPPPRRVRVIIDSIYSNARAFSDRMTRALPASLSGHVSVLAETKADANHVVCAAASILAKSARERAMAHIQSQLPEGISVGSGYSSDPVTRQFVSDAGRAQWAECTDEPFPSALIRHSWDVKK